MTPRAHILDKIIGDTLPVFKTAADVAAFEAQAPYSERVAAASTWEALQLGCGLNPQAPAITFLPNADLAEPPLVISHAQFNAQLV